MILIWHGQFFLIWCIFRYILKSIVDFKIFIFNSKRQIINSLPMAQKKKVTSVCKFHNSKCVQIGSCLTCTSACTICETKGCIKHHQENQRIHNVHTIEYVRHIVNEYVNTDQTRKAYLKKMVTDYFMLAKKQLEKLYNTIYEAIDRFKFDTIILHQEQKRIAELLIEERFSEVSCSDIANVLPKLIKCTNFEDGHFAHIRSYLRTQKQKLPNLINTMVLNLPYFREHDKESTMTKFCQISDNSLKQINRKIIALNYRPKKLRIKYIDQGQNGQEDEALRVLLYLRKKQFIKLLSTIENLNDIEVFEFYCVWDVDHDEYQIAFFEALTKFPFLTSVTVFTGFKVSSIDFVEDIFDDKNIEVRIYKKEWHF